MKKIINHKEFGNIEVFSSRSYKNLRISIPSNGKIRVSTPLYLRKSDILNFISKQDEWIRNAIEKQLKKRTNTYHFFNEETVFSTRNHQLKIIRYDGDSIYARIFKGFINIQIPKTLEIKQPEIQNIIKKTIISAIKIEAQEIITPRVEHLAKNFGFQYNKLSLKNNKSNWGSCSYSNNINLNIHLTRVPDHLINYVILHELTHTIHKNHGKDFWKHLNSITENKAVEYANEMKKYSPILF